MIEVAVKTLDGKNRSFCVPDDIVVKHFKEKIANSIEITSDTQRLIYQGRVLNDDKKLSEYDVNGKTIHVVQRPPPSQRGPSGSASASAPSSTTPGAGGPSGVSRDGNTFVLGSFSLPVDPRHVQNDGSSVDVHIHLGQVVPPQLLSESQLRVDHARRMLTQAQATLDRLENPPSPEEESTRGDSPMQTASTVPPVSTSSASSATTGSATTPPAPPPPRSGGNETNGTSETGRRTGRRSSRPQSPQHPAPTVFSELLTEVSTLNERLQPHMERVQRLMADDPTMENDVATRNAQRSFNLVSAALHYVSHAYHNISDLMVDMHRTPPRHLRATPVVGHHAQMGPMQAQVNVQTTVSGSRPTSTSTTTTSTSASASATSTAAPNSATTTTTATEMPASSVPNDAMHMTSTPLPGGGTASMASSNPYVFMELGPHALTINSISAHVVSTEDGTMPPQPTTATPRPTPDASNTNTTSSTNTVPTPSASNRPQPTGPAPAPTGVPPTRVGSTPQAFQMHFPMGAGGFPMMPGAGGIGAGLPGFSSASFGPPGAGGMVPPEVMQNILQMVTQQAFPRTSAPPTATGGTTTSTSTSSSVPVSTSVTTSSSSSSTSSSSTSSSSTSSSSATTGTGAQRTGTQPHPGAPPAGSLPGGARAGPGGMPPHAAFVIPGLFPGMGGQSPLAIDPYLPCDSHHFMTERAQLHTNNQNVGDGTTLGGMMANLVSSLMTQQNPHTHPATTQQQQQQRPVTTGTGTGTTTTPHVAAQTFNPFASLLGAAGIRPPTASPAPAGAPGAQSSPTPATAFVPAAVPQQQQQRTASQPAVQNQPPTQGQEQGQAGSGQPPAEGEFTDEVFTQLVRGISNYVAQAALGRPTDTIANFLTSLGQNYNITPSEGALMEVFNVVAHSLTFTDIMAVFYGQPAPLQTLQGPLRDIVADRILLGASPTDENIADAVSRLMQDISPEIEQACENAQGRDDIDFRATLQEFIRHNLTVAIRFIMDSSASTDQFGQHLYTLCQNVIHAFIVLGVHCLQGREQALQRLIEHQMRHVSRGVNPTIQQWMVSIPVREMTRMLNEITIPSSEIEQYVRRTGDMETSPQASEGSFMSAEENAEREFCDPMIDDPTPPSGATTTQMEAMDIDSPAAGPGGVSPPVVAAAAVTPTLESAQAAEPQNLPPPPTADPRDDVSVVIGSESWHHEVPQEWVPVIARDVRRQSREASQPPFSDAYLHGMPAKRRKIGEKKTEQELSDLSNIVPETLRRAVTAAGAESLSSIDDIATEASASLPLHTAFQQQVCDSIRNRITTDPDFSAERFPNANKFFKNGK